MPPEPVDLLIEARWVLPVSPANIALPDHAVAVRAGHIVALGPTASMNERYDPAVRISRRQHALLPGFVNAHARAAMILLRGLEVRGPRAKWMFEAVFPAEQRCMGPDYVRDGTQVAIAEMLRSGITAFADMYGFPEEAARVAAAARVRAVIGLPISDAATAWAEGATASLTQAGRLWDEYKSDPWVSLYFAPQELNDLCDETLGRVRRIADELDARIAIRLHETAQEVQTSLSIYDRSPLRRLEDLGLLRPGFTAIHVNHLEPADLQIVAGTGVCVVACPQSDLRLGSGVSALGMLNSKQVTVGLGSSDPVSAGTLDILAEARTAVLAANGALQRAGDREPYRLSAAEVLSMATSGGAAALGLGARIGTLEPGKAADLVCWKLEGLTQRAGAHAERAAEAEAPGGPAVGSSAAAEAVASAILFECDRAQASDVWTAGRPAVTEGELLGFDPQQLGALIRSWAQRARVPARRRSDLPGSLP